jgi:hypothetical protein
VPAKEALMGREKNHARDAEGPGGPSAWCCYPYRERRAPEAHATGRIFTAKHRHGAPIGDSGKVRNCPLFPNAET